MTELGIFSKNYRDDTLWSSLKPKVKYEVCANCGKQFENSDLDKWTQIIRKVKPACSYECNKALGQVK